MMITMFILMERRKERKMNKKGKNKLGKRMGKAVAKSVDHSNRIIWHKGFATRKGTLGDGSPLPWRKRI